MDIDNERNNMKRFLGLSDIMYDALIFQEICTDITGRDPSDHPHGIPYKLIAEACTPSINVSDIGSIFEEHRICKNLSVWQHNNTTENGGVYGEDENKFVFNNVLVGAKAKARFKITNTNKVSNTAGIHCCFVSLGVMMDLVLLVGKVIKRPVFEFLS